MKNQIPEQTFNEVCPRPGECVDAKHSVAIFNRFKAKVSKNIVTFLITFYEFDNKDVSGFTYEGASQTMLPQRDHTRSQHSANVIRIRHTHTHRRI